jgi:hypothetical protein
MYGHITRNARYVILLYGDEILYNNKHHFLTLSFSKLMRKMGDSELGIPTLFQN